MVNDVQEMLCEIGGPQLDIIPFTSTVGAEIEMINYPNRSSIEEYTGR
jgi:hypothetical protein